MENHLPLKRKLMDLERDMIENTLSYRRQKTNIAKKKCKLVQYVLTVFTADDDDVVVYKNESVFGHVDEVESRIDAFRSFGVSNLASLKP